MRRDIQRATADGGARYAVRAGRSWDPVVGAVDGPALVVCSPADGRIVAVDHTGATAPDGAEVRDFGDRATVLPGLVDGHVHLCWDPHGDPVAQFLEEPDEVLAVRVQDALEASLRAGITTLRDLGDRGYLTLRREVAVVGDSVAGTGDPRVGTTDHPAEGPLLVPGR